MPLHQLGEGVLGTVPGELFQQPVIRHIGHSPIICAPTVEPNRELLIFRLFHHQQLNGHIGGNKFEAELVEVVRG